MDAGDEASKDAAQKQCFAKNKQVARHYAELKKERAANALARADAAAGRSRQPPRAVGPNPSGGGDGAAWVAGDLGLDLGGARAATATAATTAALPAALAAAAAFAATVTALECAAAGGGKSEQGGSSAWCSGPTNCIRRHTGNSCAVSACFRRS